MIIIHSDIYMLQLFHQGFDSFDVKEGEMLPQLNLIRNKGFQSCLVDSLVSCDGVMPLSPCDVTASFNID